MLFRASEPIDPLLAAIRSAEARLRPLDATQRLAHARSLSGRLAHKHPSSPEARAALPDLFALVLLAAEQTLGLTFHEVQIRAGLLLTRRSVVELQTGEGKTLVATLPLALAALTGQGAGQGAWLATANDYLAQRDAETMRPLYRQLGLTVDAVVAGLSPLARREAYRADITYGTAREFGFDFLRDRLLLREQPGLGDDDPLPLSLAARLTQRPPAFVLVDEADSVLIDEARLPLILSGPGDHPPAHIAAYHWAARHAEGFLETRDYLIEKQQVWLTAPGRERVRQLPLPRELNPLRLPELYEFIERALKVQRDYQRDRHYILQDGKIVLIDEQTGRPGPGRQWQDGLHQAVEAREQLALSPRTETLARITLQDYFGRFPHLAGLTGTALPAAAEFQSAYRLTVVALPTHAPSRRETLPPQVFATLPDKWEAVTARVVYLHMTGRPILVGTRTISDSLELARRFTEAGLTYQLLNASQLADEAEIVAQAGQIGRITIATNMAGRGTDIRLGAGVAALGGLFVLITELHDSARVDAQLEGRCARQGDPGSTQQFASLEDRLVASALGPKSAARWQSKAQKLARQQEAAQPATTDHAATSPLPPPLPSQLPPRWFEWLKRLQTRLERQQARQRKALQTHAATRRQRAQTLGQSLYAE